MEAAYANCVTVRLVFSDGRCITEGDVGIENCLILALDNFEPRNHY